MLFSTAKKIEELQAKLQAAIDENETLKANAKTAQSELDRIKATLRAEDDEEEKPDAEEHDDEEEMKKGKKSKRAADPEKDEDAEDEDEDYEAEDEDEDEEPSALVKVKAMKAKLAKLEKAQAALAASLDSKVSAAISTTLAKMGIDPIHATATADGTKANKEKPKGRNGIERAGVLLNEKIKAQR